MIRFRSVATAKYGHFADVLSLNEALNEVCRARGWPEAKFFVPADGEMNVLVAEYEYPDYAAFEAASNGSMSDPEFMKTYRQIGALIYPQSARSELLESAPHLA